MVKTRRNIVAFRITGEFAHFRNPFVTSYLSTYPFPPKPTVLGMIGAIMGYSPLEVLNLQNTVKISIKLNRPPTKALDYVRLWKFDEKKDIVFSPVKMEMLVRPDYTIFVSSKNEEFITALQKRLETRDFVYPISLGKNEFVAFVKEAFPISYNVDREVEVYSTDSIDSILPVKIGKQQKITPPDITTNNWATVSFVPVELELAFPSGTRRVKTTGTFAYSLNGEPIKTKEKIQAIKVKLWNIVMF